MQDLIGFIFCYIELSNVECVVDGLDKGIGQHGDSFTVT